MRDFFVFSEKRLAGSKEGRSISGKVVRRTRRTRRTAPSNDHLQRHSECGEARRDDSQEHEVNVSASCWLVKKKDGAIMRKPGLDRIG